MVLEADTCCRGIVREAFGSENFTPEHCGVATHGVDLDRIREDGVLKRLRGGDFFMCHKNQGSDRTSRCVCDASWYASHP